MTRDMEAGREALAPGLYVVATPIGNLGDVTLRALEVLKAVDLVAAEDTRVTRTLLSHFGIASRLVALHAHNERRASAQVLGWLAEGRRVALVSDAGTPAVSDPGALVVAAAREAGYAVHAIPGPSALTAALSVAGLEADGVLFAGFLPARGKERKARLEALAQAPWAIALYESPHRIEQTLADLARAFGGREVVIARELTKRFESVVRLPLEGALEWIRGDADRSRGEFVVIVGPGAVDAPKADAARVLDALLAELPASKAAAVAAKITGQSRGGLYSLALERRGRK